MVIYNKGRRSYDIDMNEGKTPAEIKRLEPGKTIEVSKSQGERLTKKYHKDLVDHENMSPGKKSKNEKLIEELRKENKELILELKRLKEPKTAKK